MNKKTIFLAACAIVLTLAAAMDSAWAYFTTYAQASGGYTISLGDKTTVQEDFSDWTKRVTISNDAGAEPVYIRAKAFCGSEYQLVYSDSTGKWTPGEDGYYYYSDIVEGGGTTSELQVKIGNIPENAEEADSFNVVVIYESTSVRYREDGTPYADWTVTLDSGSAEGGV